jgi:Family of unknown function (DUF6527)
VSTPLRIVDGPPLDDHGYPNPWAAEPGDMWRCPSHGGSHDIEGRGPCWVIRLPGRAWVFHTNMPSSDGGYWTVTGEPPAISITPSINVGPEIWHGWITNGVMAP